MVRNEKKYLPKEPLKNQLTSYFFKQENIKYTLFVIVSGFSAGFFVWSMNIEKNLFYAFIFQNILSPENRTKLLLFLFVGILSTIACWILISIALHYKNKEPLKTILDKASSWFFLGAILWFHPILSIQAFEVYYPFQVFILLLVMLILLLYIVYNISTRSKNITELHGSVKRKWEKISLYLAISFSIGYALFFIIYTVSKHYSFHSYAFDLGWQNQVFYSIVHRGVPQITAYITLNPLSNHFTPFYYLLAPIYAIYQDPVTLLVLQALFLASGVVPLYLLAKKRLNSNLLAIIISLVYVLYPALHGLNTYDFHGLVFFIPITIFLLYFLETDRMKLFWIFFILALITREDTPFTLIGVGLYIYLILKKQKLGVLVSVSSIAYFLFVLYSMSALGGSANSEKFVELALPESQGFLGAITTIFTNPFFAFKHIFFNSDKLIYLFQIFLPILFLPFFAMRKMLIALPGFALILLSSSEPHYSIGFHYSTHIIPFIFFLTICGIENIKKKWPQLKNIIFAVPLLFAGIYMNYEFGLIYSKRYPGIPKATEREKIAYSFFQDIPANASIITNSRLYTHISSREKINLIYRMDEDIEYVLADTFPPTPALDLYEIVYRGHTLDERGIQAILFDLMNSNDYGVVRYNDGFVLLKKGFDVSNNKSTIEKIKSLEYEPPGTIINYFTDPSSSIPKPFISVSDVFINYVRRNQTGTVLISVKGDATKRFTYKGKKYFVLMDSKINTLKRGGSYIAIIHRNKIIYEKISNSSAIEIDNSISKKVSSLFSGINLEISSAGYKYGDYSSIKINGNEYSQNKRGFNVVVLDRYMKVKESARFDMWQKIYNDRTEP